jgi:ribosome-associated heat shock protein Hsp15
LFHFRGKLGISTWLRETGLCDGDVAFGHPFGAVSTGHCGCSRTSEDVRMDAVRIDKWIWAARFFKTRGLASEAILAGHVHLNHVRVKPSKDVRVGDELEIRIGTTQWTVVVVTLSDKRGPAKVAQLLYSETEQSREAREQEALQRKLAPAPIGSDLGTRPTKQDRRRLDALRRSQRRG